jgi:predicted TIM-barrel fold metal-dependent hydrolase
MNQIMIDIFTHILPAKYLKALEKKGPNARRSQSPGMADLDLRLKMMEEFPGMMQVLSVPDPALETLINPEDILELAKGVNDELAEIVRRYPDKFPAAIAMLPFNNNIDSTLGEIDRAVKDLGLRGVLICTNVNGKPLDSPEFMDIYEKMEKYDLPIFLHPRNKPAEHDYPGEQGSKYSLDVTVGWPHETTMAMMRLSGSGILEKYPKLKIVTHHCGGTVPYLVGRIRHAPFKYESLTRPITDSLLLFYNDTAVQGNTANLMCSYAFCGGDHLVFGTDFPLASSNLVMETIRSINAMTIPEVEKKKIFEENARKLLHLV